MLNNINGGETSLSQRCQTVSEPGEPATGGKCSANVWITMPTDRIENEPLGDVVSRRPQNREGNLTVRPKHPQYLLRRQSGPWHMVDSAVGDDLVEMGRGIG
jgi:hypothetical protein